MGADRHPVVFPTPQTFCIKAYRAIIPVTEVTEELLTGKLETIVTASDVILFEGVSFADVTSNYPENWVFVVVQCTSQTGVKPLVLEGVRVKARKSQLTEL